MSEREPAPLTASETASLRLMAQELTRTDPYLLALPAGRDPGSGVRIRPGTVGTFAAAVAVLVGASGLAFGAVPALATGLALTFAGTAACWVASARGVRPGSGDGDGP